MDRGRRLAQVGRAIGQRFVQAALVRYRDQDVWSFELVAQDVLDVPRTLAAFRRVLVTLDGSDVSEVALGPAREKIGRAHV